MLEKHTRSDLIDSVYQHLLNNVSNGDDSRMLSRTIVTRIVNGFIDELKQSLSQGHPVEIRGFGVFEFRNRKAKKNARNPKNGEKVQVSPHTVVAFRSGNDIRDAVWNLNIE